MRRTVASSTLFGFCPVLNDTTRAPRSTRAFVQPPITHVMLSGGFGAVHGTDSDAIDPNTTGRALGGPDPEHAQHHLPLYPASKGIVQ